MNFMLEKHKINISIEKSVWIENRQDLFVQLLVSVSGVLVVDGWMGGWVNGWMNEWMNEKHISANHQRKIGFMIQFCLLCVMIPSYIRCSIYCDEGTPSDVKVLFIFVFIPMYLSLLFLFNIWRLHSMFGTASSPFFCSSAFDGTFTVLIDVFIYEF